MGNNKGLIQATIKSLSSAEREQLKYAHQYSVPNYVKLPHGRFIGVYCNGIPNLIAEHEHNDWYIGTINYPTQ